MAEPGALIWLRTLVRFGLAGVFVVAGALKVLDPTSSVEAVRAYQLLPAELAEVVGWGLPFVEIVLGLLLASGLFPRVVAAAAATVLLVFVAAVVSVAARGLSIDCGCFGGGGPVAPGQTGYPGELVRDIAFLLAAGWLVWRPRTRMTLNGFWRGVRDPDALIGADDLGLDADGRNPASGAVNAVVGGDIARRDAA